KRQALAAGLKPPNHKQVYRVMKVGGAGMTVASRPIDVIGAGVPIEFSYELRNISSSCLSSEFPLTNQVGESSRKGSDRSERRLYSRFPERRAHNYRASLRTQPSAPGRSSRVQRQNWPREQTNKDQPGAPFGLKNVTR